MRAASVTSMPRPKRRPPGGIRENHLGIVTAGIPGGIVTALAKAAGATVFVETGTFRGATTRWAASRFAEVHTIEREPALHAANQAALSALPGVQAHLGDSRTVLPGIVASLGAKPSVALNPATPVSAVAHVLDLVDMVLVMTVNPGFGGQRYIATMEPKIREVRAMIQAAGLTDGPGVCGLLQASGIYLLARLTQHLVHVGELGEWAHHGAAVAHGAKGPRSCWINRRLVHGEHQQRRAALMGESDCAGEGAVGRLAALVADQNG